MSARFRFQNLALISLFGAILSGCGGVETVRQRFAVRPVATPSPAQIARIRENRGYTSLGRSLQSLDAEKLRAAIARFTSQTEAIFQTAPLVPMQIAPMPSAIFNDLTRDLSSSTRPIAPEVDDFKVANFAFQNQLSAPNSSATTQISPARVLRAPFQKSNAQNDARRELASVLTDWALRQAQLRAQDEILARRNIADRVSGATRAAVEAVPLSPVPPEVQAQLTNLRLQLLQNLDVAPQKREQSRARIEAIEAQLREIWAQETRRQQALLKAALEDVPAQLKRENLEKLARAVASQIGQDRAARLSLRNEFERVLKLAQNENVASGALKIAQPAVLAPANHFPPQKIQTAPNVAASARPRMKIEIAKGTLEVGLSGANLSAPLRAQAQREREVWAQATR